MRLPIKTLILILILINLFSCNEEKSITSPDGVHQSEGNVWIPLSEFPDTNHPSQYFYLYDIAVNSGSEIYAAIEYCGVFRSTDNGSSWTLIDNGLLESNSHYYISVLMYSGQDVYTVCANSQHPEIFKFNKTELTWHSQRISDEYSTVTCLKTYKPWQIFAGCNRGLYLTENMGISWNDISPNRDSLLIPMVICIDFDSNDNVYLGTDNGLYKSKDYGQTWTHLGFENKKIVSIAINSSNDIFLDVENYRIVRSVGVDTVWKDVFTEIPSYSLLINADDIIFAGTLDGVYRSTNNGTDWEQIGLPNLTVQKLILNSKGYILAGSFRNGIFISKE